MNSVVTFVMIATVLGMAGVNLSLPLLSGADQVVVPDAVAEAGRMLFLGLSIAGLGLVLVLKSK